QAAPPRVRGCALYSARVFMQPFFYSDHGFGMILNKNKALKSIFCTKFASGNTTDFIKGGGLLSSLTPYFLT
ncbi:hypothetical protein, partial [Escherichia sp. E14V7]|uniref:hypothetical protein n=2 Tax=Escherichia TaxID=561 RepID=UPI00197AE3D4